MTKMDWRKARRERPEGAMSLLDYKRRLRAINDAAVARSKVTVTSYAAHVRGVSWPIYVTVPDPHQPAGLRVRCFKDRQEADAAGFEWIGR